MILIVDDNEYLARIIQELLDCHHLSSEVVSSAPDAMNKIASRHYNVIITDIHMPEVSGIEFVNHLNETHYPAEVIVYSGNMTKDEVLDLLTKDNVFAVHQKNDLIEKLLLSTKKAELFNDCYRESGTAIH